MTNTTSNKTHPSPIIAQFITTLGFLWGFFVIFFAILLPFAWSPALKWPIYSQIRWILLSGAAFAPFLIVAGLKWQYSPSLSNVLTALRKTLGYELILVGIYWFLQNIFQATQLGWTALRSGPSFIFQKHGLLWGGVVWTPLLLSLGYSLITQSKFRRHLGIVLTTIGYQSLVFLGLFRLFLSLAPQFVPLLAPLPSQTQITHIALTLALIPIPLFLVGLLLIYDKKFSLRLHLMLSFPLWIPFFIIFFFWALVVDTTLYFIEEIFHFQPPSHPLFKILAAPFCLILFPFLLTIDFSIGLIKLLGHYTMTKFFSPQLDDTDEIPFSNTQIYLVGTTLLFTLPIWAIPVILYGSIKLFAYESILMHLIGTKAFESQKH